MINKKERRGIDSIKSLWNFADMKKIRGTISLKWGRIYLYLKIYFSYFLNFFSDHYFNFFLHKGSLSTLQGTLTFCNHAIPFHFRKGLNLADYPLISKTEVKQNLSSMTSRKWIKSKAMTSGTTGTPGIFFRDIDSIMAETYFQNRYFKWNSLYKIVIRAHEIIDLGQKPKIIFRKMPFLRQMEVSSFHMNDESMELLVNELEKIKDKCLWAYPSTAYLLAEFCLRRNRKLKFKMVATSSEILLDYQIPIIELAFGCKIKDWYGLAERVAALYRCPSNHYHEMEGYSHIEYLHSQDDIYEIVGTSFYNKIMPLIRYRTGDFVRVSKTPCPCGSPGINIHSILGRDVDFIDLPEKRLPGILLNIPIQKAKNIRESQIIQKKDKKLIIKIVASKEFNQADELLLKREFATLLPDNDFTFDYVDQIAKGEKFRFIIKEN